MGKWNLEADMRRHKPFASIKKFSHVLELENRIKWLEDIVRARAPDVDLQAGPPVELRSRPSPPAIRIVTTGPDFHPPPSSMSSTSSPSFALSPASTCATPASFDFSPVPSPNYLAPVSPYTFSDGPSPSPSSAPSSPLLASSPLFQPQDPVSQDVGLLSLSAFEEPKYVGSSSSVSFARLVFQDASSGELRQPDFDQGGRDVGSGLVLPGLDSKPAALPNTDECVILSSTYFTTVALQYPFLHRQTFDACLEATYHAENGAIHHLPSGYTATVARFHVFMVLSIGANILSGRGRASRSMASDSEGYFASAMQVINDISITGSLTGVQSALLLAMRSLHASEGPNVWYLNAVIMATCVDLGFQRKIISYRGQDHAGIKKRIFWCAYALDRNLGIALGRPFSLRDESFDADFPEEGDNDEELHHMASLPMGSNMSGSIENARASFSGSICLFRMMKVISGIGTTIYRVSQPHVGRWQVDLPEWQMATYRQLTELRDQVRVSLGGVRRGSGSTGSPLGSGQMVELKYHEAVQLLFRPSPAFPKPTTPALQHCFSSSVEAVRIQSKLKRYGELQHSWPTAQSIFASGIMMLYAYKNCREVQTHTTHEVLMEDINSCSSLLGDLAERWPLAQRSKTRFDAYASIVVNQASTNASRMLSPQDGTRRASNSSVHSQRGFFAEIQSQSQSRTLEVPSLHQASSPAPAPPPPQQLNTPSWFSGDPTGGSGAAAQMDTSWVDTFDWGFTPADFPASDGIGFDGLDPVGEDVLSVLLSAPPSGTGGDTSMWGMEQGDHDRGI